MKNTAYLCYLSLGSNLGDRRANLREAIRRLREVGTVVAVSSFYETEPVEVEEQQPLFLNCVLAMETQLTPGDLLHRILELEKNLGRIRTGVKAPRTIDLDIVLFGDWVVDSPDLTIPHPAMHQRGFVLAPLAEIAPDVVHPVLKLSIHDLLLALPPGPGVRQFVAANKVE